MADFKNYLKGLVSIIVLMILVTLGLSVASFRMGAGNAAYELSRLFVFAQTLILILCYSLWYCKVNKQASNMMYISDIMHCAVRHGRRYWIISFIITAAIGGAAVVCMIVHILFIDIDPIYCYTSVFSMCILGNLTLLLLMRYLALPNRVTGSY